MRINSNECAADSSSSDCANLNLTAEAAIVFWTCGWICSRRGRERDVVVVGLPVVVEVVGGASKRLSKRRWMSGRMLRDQHIHTDIRWM